MSIAFVQYVLNYQRPHPVVNAAENAAIFSRVNVMWHSSLPQPFRQHYGPGVDSASNRNEYQEYFLWGRGGRCVGLTTLPPSFDSCLEIWKPQPPATLRACTDIALPLLPFTRYVKRRCPLQYVQCTQHSSTIPSPAETQQHDSKVITQICICGIQQSHVEVQKWYVSSGGI